MRLFMINEKVFLGIPLSFEKDIKVYPPTIKDVIGNENFGFYRKLLLQSQEDIEDEIEEARKKNPKAEIKDIPTPFEYLLGVIASNETFQIYAKEAFRFFIHEDATFLIPQKMIVLGNLEEKLKKVKNVNELSILTTENFFTFQNLLRKAIGEKEAILPDPNEHPKKKYMRMKARQRDKAKAKTNGLPLSSSLLSLCCMGVGLTPLNIGEIPYASVSAIMDTYQAKEKYEIDLKSMLAGAKGVKLKYWIRDFDKD